ncbi:SOS response-associated peptidase [Pseudomonas multiresinivorans]|uniref:SOS response-associated peptidase n=1 Tax=Pseudomonas multiresinivorans TaxID=95301 RepID=UPI0023F64A84|nr:SOS response-associated peptidase family protein [Pseudomonas multiresinivorans]
MLAIAGIWSTWSPPEGEPITSCALLTKEAEGLVSAIHHRMPVILSPQQWKTWLSPDTSLDLAYDTIALARQDFEAYRISTDVGSVRNQGAQLIEPI